MAMKKFTCKDCHIKISAYRTRCKSCAQKYLYILNPNKSKGENSNNWKGGKPNCKKCGKQLSNYRNIHCGTCVRKDWMKDKKHKLTTKKKMSVKQEGKLNSMYGKVTHAVHGRYNGIFMRSSWELAFARFLTLSGIKWKYESKTFNLGNTTYTPDFYLPEFDLYIELKGWWRGNTKAKFLKFKKIYRNVGIMVLMEKNLKQLGVLN